ncbi:MAG TPA: energy-coupling factor transporter ATPase, partial [Erysipelothrix sp.]|nr:energy-coupling factor transporter ATPase [Erysipelothrix sp.]
FSYDGKTDVLKNVSLDIKKGDYVSIIGHNGSGKSTLAKLIVGLMEADAGDILIEGEKLTYENVYAMREKLAIVFQNPDNQFIGSTVRDDIAFGLENRRVDPDKMDAIIEEYAKSTGMGEYLDHEPTKLSGGQKQRVAIAGVLSMHPSVLILDEATSMLDPKGKKEVNELVHELHKKNKMTILSITHDIEEVTKSDYVVVMNQGEVFMSGKPEDVLMKVNRLQKIGLDIPFSVKFNLELQKQGITLKNAFDEEGMVDELWQLSLKK